MPRYLVLKVLPRKSYNLNLTYEQLEHVRNGYHYLYDSKTAVVMHLQNSFFQKILLRAVDLIQWHKRLPRKYTVMSLISGNGGGGTLFILKAFFLWKIHVREGDNDNKGLVVFRPSQNINFSRIINLGRWLSMFFNHISMKKYVL